jgi:prohibitin 1
VQGSGEINFMSQTSSHFRVVLAAFVLVRGEFAFIFCKSTLVKISVQIRWSAGLVIGGRERNARGTACRALLGMDGRERPSPHRHELHKSCRMAGWHTIGAGRNLMTIFNDARGRVIDANPGSAIRLFGIALVAFLVVIALFASVVRVDSGHVGVLTLFGRVTGEVLPEGVHLVNPFKSSNELSIRTQEIKESASVPSAEGLVMNLDTSLIYHLNPEKAAEVYQKIGPNYMAVLVEPNLRAAIRESTASHSANALYTGEREAVAKQIYSQLADKLGQRGILVESVLLRDIQLPATLKSSIESKQQAEQEALAMNFRLQKETQEAQRKRIEAAGIRDFQQIVAQGISPQLLEWKGIEATENLAKSTNSKVVVIGNSKNGLPLILGQ